MAKQSVIIDAAGKKLGRLASEVALALRGKNDADFLPSSTDLPTVSVKNLAEIDISEKKLEEKMIIHYTGYPGGLRKIKAMDLWDKDKDKLFRHAVAGMLPQNRLKKRMLRNLKLEHGEGK